MSKHTQGKWETGGTSGMGHMADVVWSGTEYICELSSSYRMPKGSPEQLANARLIAAAPALYDWAKAQHQRLSEMIERYGYTENDADNFGSGALVKERNELAQIIARIEGTDTSTGEILLPAKYTPGDTTLSLTFPK
jgi:hypothetical protein